LPVTGKVENSVVGSSYGMRIDFMMYNEYPAAGITEERKFTESAKTYRKITCIPYRFFFYKLHP
jgi:hypothetical protein